MFCQTCGGKLRAKARFCNQCGQAVVERFGSALLKSPPPPPDAPLPPNAPTLKFKTAPVKSPHTLEGQTLAATDPLAHRGTGRQAQAKFTREDAKPNEPTPSPRSITSLTTQVDLPVFPDLNLPAETSAPAAASPAPASPADANGPATLVVEVAQIASLLESTPAPSAAAAMPAQPLPATNASRAAKPDSGTLASANPDAPGLGKTTIDLERESAAKPFFTETLNPAQAAGNKQHRRLGLAVPIVLIIAVILIILAFLTAK